MEAPRSTDYLADIPKAALPGPPIPISIRDEAIRWRTVVDFSLLALVLTTAAIVTTVILNWAH
jgi:hypothetical protein